MVAICSNLPQSCPEHFDKPWGKRLTLCCIFQFILALAGKYLTTNGLVINRFYPFSFHFEKIFTSKLENTFLQNYSLSWQILCSFPSLQLFTELLRLSHIASTPTPLPKQSQLKQVSQDCVRGDFEVLQGLRFQTSLDSFSQWLSHLTAENYAVVCSRM